MLEGAVKELQSDIKAILQAIGRMETDIKHLSHLSVKLDQTSNLAIQIEASVKSAHKRLDGLAGQTEQLERRIEADKKASREDRKWLWGFIVGAAALLWKLLESLIQRGGGAS